MSTLSGLGFGQYGEGPNGEPIIQRIISPLMGFVGNQIQLEVADIYLDGSGSGLADPGSWWTLDPSILLITAGGLATCVSAGTVLIGTVKDGSVFIEGNFVVASPAIVSILITGNVASLNVGQTEQLSVIATYSDGTTGNVTSQVTWNGSGPGAAVNGTGLVTALKPSLNTITASIGLLSTSVSLLVNQIDQLDSGAPVFRSHLTPIMQNYFDENDPRVRRGRYTIDAQLLNTAAQQIEMSELRLSRELGSRTLHACPANIDNSGCYWKQRLPSSFDYSLNSHIVIGTRAGSSVTLTEYDDQLPVPARVTANSGFDPVLLSDPQIFSVTGLGDTHNQSWAAQKIGPFLPAFANRIQFWLDGPTYYALKVLVRITGIRAPAPAWADAQVTSSETVTLSQLGWSSSKFAWFSITHVQVLGLPDDVTLSGYTGMFSMPLYPDPARPYTDHMYRDVVFDRYWKAEPGFLTEQYLESDFAGWRFAQSYVTQQNLSAIAVEPYTHGMYAASGTSLYYFDRREPLPSELQASALQTEPYYGLEIVVDETQLTPVRFVVLTPVPYAKAASATRWRFVVKNPDGNTYVLTPNGFLATLTSTSGWRTDIPPSLTMPLAQLGTYVFSLQVVGPDGLMVQDSTPWPNLPFIPKATFDLSSIVTQIQGLSFDDRGRLWVWDGSKAVALQAHYDGYLIDEATQAIYLTDSVDGLLIDGLTL